MSSLTDDEVRRRLQELSRANPKNASELKPAQPDVKPGAKALRYIDQLMEDQTKYKTKGTVDQFQSTSVKPQKIALQSPANPPGQSSSPADEFWLRIQLAPWVELHLRTPMDPLTENRVQQLINFAKKIFQIKS
jgi:hypothetical protein